MPVESVPQHHRDRPSLVSIRGAREHNLKNVSVAFPRDSFVVVTGPSGSGKSSLVFQTIYREVLRKQSFWLSGGKGWTGVKADVDSVQGIPFAVSFEGRTVTSPWLSLASISGFYNSLVQLFIGLGLVVCPKCGERTRYQTKRQFISQLVCGRDGREVRGIAPLGKLAGTSLKAKSLELFNQGFTRIVVDSTVLRQEEIEGLAENEEFEAALFIDVFRLSKASELRLVECIEIGLQQAGEVVQFDIEGESKPMTFTGRFLCRGCQYELPEPKSKNFNYQRKDIQCLDCAGYGCLCCQGTRLRNDVGSYSLAEKSFADVLNLTINDLSQWVTMLANRGIVELSVEQGLTDLVPTEKEREHLARVLAELGSRLNTLVDLGLGYLTSMRSVTTLSEGEFRRAQLSKQLFQSLQGVCFLLDEPSIGLHPRDTEQLLLTLKRLVRRGNSLLVIEHDPEVISSADYVIRLGPGSGTAGGEVTYSGPGQGYSSVQPQSVRQRWSDVVTIHPIEEQPQLVLSGIRKHNLKNITVSVPLGRFVTVVGVSGSGKSTLLFDCLVPALRIALTKRRPGLERELSTTELNGLGVSALGGAELITRVVDSRRGFSERGVFSIVATKCGVFPAIRRLFSQTIESRVRGYSSRDFSFVTAGACTHCRGNGRERLERGETAAICHRCRGTRYRPEILEVTYRGRSIVDVLRLTIQEASRLFQRIPEIVTPLRQLCDLGLDYLTLTQPVSCLSRGELQRLSLARDLNHRVVAGSLYCFEEPTEGQSEFEISLLIAVFRKLVSQGSTVVVIEHNPQLIAASDFILDLGSNAGEQGGYLVASGAPAALQLNKSSSIGKYL